MTDDKRIERLETDLSLAERAWAEMQEDNDVHIAELEARIAALEAAIEAKDISIKTLSMLLRTNLLLRHPDRTYEEVDADIRKIVEGTDV